MCIPRFGEKSEAIAGSSTPPPRNMILLMETAKLSPCASQTQRDDARMDETPAEQGDEDNDGRGAVPSRSPSACLDSEDGLPSQSRGAVHR
jgi:hypothetical protein